MRAEDLHPSHTYLLAGPRQRLVTVLDTPPEVRRRARVRVRFLNGVKAGEVADVPSRRVLTALTGPATRAQPRARPVRPARVLRDPEIGDEVLWEKTGPLVWTVDSIDCEHRTAVINTIIMQRPTTQSTPLAELQVRPAEIAEPAPAPPAPSPPVRALDSPPVSLAPDKPRRELDEILDDVLFSPRCLREYQRRFAKSLSGGAVNEAMRSEVRLRGYLMGAQEDGAGEYGRIRVLGRFDIVLPAKPTPEAPVTVNGLYVPAPAARRKRRGKRAA